MKVHQLSRGEVYRGRITRISNAGNAIIRLRTGFVNLGEGTQDEVGDTVTFEKRGGSSGERVSDSEDDSILHVNKEVRDRKSKAETKKESRTSHGTTHLSLKTVGESFSGSANDLLSNYNNDA